MNYRLVFSKNFKVGLNKLSKGEQKLVLKKVHMLSANPFYPSLRTKKIQGIENLFECSVTMDIRIIWKYEDGAILLLFRSWAS